MERTLKMSIDIASSPSKAIKQISDPILKVIEAKTEHHELELRDMQLDRTRKQRRLAELKEQILAERFRQVDLRRDIEEQKEDIVTLEEDISFAKTQLVDQKKRKEALQKNLEAMTKMFQNEQRLVTRGQKESQDKLILGHAQKEIAE